MDPELAQWIPLLQIITNATLTIVGICVAAASLYVAYRNNFGWDPIALIGGIGLKGVGGEHLEFSAVITLEIWNRRKYPVSIRHINLDIQNLKIRRHRTKGPNEKWLIGSNYVSHLTPHILGPNEHERHEIEVPFTAPSLDALNAPIHIRVAYFDPKRHVTKVLTFDHVYRLTPEPQEVFA